jgi:uncharacterized protein (TIGR02453 family)
MPDSPSFTGFPAGTQRFLRELSSHNTKPWFDEHRDDYERYYLAPAVAFVSAIGPKLKKLSPSIQFAPKVNGSIMRINRDTRFSKDKSPYKNHLDMWFWEGEKKGWDMPGYFLRIESNKVTVGAGMHHFMGSHLDAYRRAVVDEKTGRALVVAVKKVRDAGYDVFGATRKTTPRGFDAEHPRAELLKHDGLWSAITGPAPKELSSPAFVDYCVGHLETLTPLNAWLGRAVR